MIDHVLKQSGLAGGTVLDLGPFAGGMRVELLSRGGAFRTVIVDRFQAVLGGPEPIPAPAASVDLVLVRGAFFFFSAALLGEVRRVLRPGGFGWVGGGYGSLTPAEVGRPLVERSRLLNESIGKRRVSAGAVRRVVATAGLAGCARVVEEGGLWIEVRP